MAVSVCINGSFVVLVHLSVFMSVPSCCLLLWLCNIIWGHILYLLLFLFRIDLAVWSLLFFHMNFMILSSVKNIIGGFNCIWILWVAFGSVVIFITLILPVHEHTALLVSSSTSFFGFLKFSLWRYFTP